MSSGLGSTGTITQIEDKQFTVKKSALFSRFVDTYEMLDVDHYRWATRDGHISPKPDLMHYRCAEDGVTAINTEVIPPSGDSPQTAIGSNSSGSPSIGSNSQINASYPSGESQGVVIDPETVGMSRSFSFKAKKR
jgi:hypothetical protein